ncbi:uncharacterized protein LOC122865583 [Siniperca chuatsi]|uniref:uncharacterized protein LOC122865583 n=1 Tax=Siniperca chuatsi TaxID=119488 RepID=UPI001CE0A285|nr:uncharacterized protein LOC122865583 [Siniperca chuatsi]
MSSGPWILINHWNYVAMTPLYHGLKAVDKSNTQLISTNKTTEKQEGCVTGNKSTSSSPPWNSLGAKPKSKSFPWEMGGRVTGRAQCPEICDATGWLALSSRQNATTQPWTAAKGRVSNKPPQQPSVHLQNKFAPLLQDSGSLSDDLDNLSSSHSRDKIQEESKQEDITQGGRNLEGELPQPPPEESFNHRSREEESPPPSPTTTREDSPFLLPPSSWSSLTR